MYGTNGYNAYKKNSVNLASKDQLLLMLVDGAVKYSKISRQALEDNDLVKANDNLIRTQDIFVELMTTLNTDAGEWTENLLVLYNFINKKLIETNINKDIKILDETIPLIEGIRDMWYDVNKAAKKAL